MFAHHGTLARVTAFMTAVALLALESGCATQPPSRPSLDLHARLHNQTVAIVSPPVTLDTSAELFARGWFAGALKGAAEGPIKVMAYSPPGRCQGEMCGAVIILWAAMAVTLGITVGAVEGAMKATPQAEAARMDKQVQSAIARTNAHLDLASRVLAIGSQLPGVQLEQVLLASPPLSLPPDYTDFHRSGYGAILEVAVTELHFQEAPGGSAKLRLIMTSSARAIDPATAKVLFAMEFQHTTPYTEWQGASGDDILRVLDDGIQATARAMVATVFESVDLPLPRNEWAVPGSGSFGWCWLDPISPPRDYQFWGARLRTPLVASVTPTLSWQPFPNIEQAGALHRAVGLPMDRVTYDLRIWEPRIKGIPTVVYQRQGLQQPSHAVEVPLQRDMEYYWSIRACFPYDTLSVCTPWAFSAAPAVTPSSSCDSPVIPLANYYRFRTPR